MNPSVPTASVSASGRLSWRDWLFVFAAPVVAFFVLRISPIIQAGYLDPWLYSGFGQIFQRAVECYGYPYYYVRFPVVMLNRLFCSGEDTYVGYLLLRYLLIVGPGLALYEWSLKSFGRAAAVVGYLFLFCNPHYVRTIAWDLTMFVSVPAALAGAALWLHDEARISWRHFAAGFLFCFAAAAHVFTAMPIACFGFGVLVGHVWHRRGWKVPAAQAALALAGFAAAWAVGWWYYHELVGLKDPWIFAKVTRDAMKTGSAYAVANARPVASWIFMQNHWWGPFLVVLAAACLPRPRARRAREAHVTVLAGAVAVAAFYLIYRFVLGRFVLEEFYYSMHIWAVVALAVPLVAAQFTADESGAARGAVAVGAAALVGVVWLHLGARMIGWNHPVQGPLTVGVILAVVVAAIIGGRFAPARWRLCALAAFFVALQVLTVRAPNYMVFGTENDAMQRDTYRAGAIYGRLWTKYARAQKVPLLWYAPPKGLADMWSVSFVTLGHTLHDKWRGPGMPVVTDYDRQRLNWPNGGYIFLMSKDAADFTAARAALEKAGLQFESEELATVESGQLKFFVEVLAYTPLPPVNP